jgi:hypothetical protein
MLTGSCHWFELILAYQAISSAPIGVAANRKGKQPSFRFTKSLTAAICRPY